MYIHKKIYICMFVCIMCIMSTIVSVSLEATEEEAYLYVDAARLTLNYYHCGAFDGVDVCMYLCMLYF